MGARTSGGWILAPREHGAWGILLEPFVAGVLLARAWDWRILAALGLVLSGFLIREPLIVLARQRWVWREEKPESAAARRSLLWELPLAAASFGLLWAAVPRTPFLILCGVGVSLTALAVWMTVRNRQRSVWLQVASTLGMGTTAHLAALALTLSIPAWCWWLWALKCAHFLASLLLVHARLELRAGKREGSAPVLRGVAIQQAALWLCAFGVLFWSGGRLAVPLFCSALAGLVETLRLRRPASLSEPLTRVGLRTLAVSLAHTAIATVALWQW